MPRFNAQHYFNFLLSTHAIPLHQPRCLAIASLMPCARKRPGEGMRRFMSYGKEYLRRRNELKRVENFHQVIRILRVNFSHHFAALFEHSVIFCVNDAEKFIIASILAGRDDEEQSEARRESKIESELGVGDKHP